MIDEHDYANPNHPINTHCGAQLAIVGYDWLSDRDKKEQARAEEARRKAAVQLIKRLNAASEALSDFLLACIDCRDGSSGQIRGEADSRRILMRDINEYSSWLSSVYAATAKI